VGISLILYIEERWAIDIAIPAPIYEQKLTKIIWEG
jgi:nitroreductase